MCRAAEAGMQSPRKTNLTRTLARTAASFLCALAVFATAPPLAAVEEGTPEWLRQARVAGAQLYSEMTTEEIEKNISELAAQHVSVIEADSDLSRWLSDAEFEREIALMRRYTEAAHRQGMRVVWYAPTLEVLSPNAREGRRSMYQLHPDWVQRGLDGKPNVFVGGRHGGRGRVHWVDPGTESAWMSPHSPYADAFVERIGRIAATGVDGIWLDVPLYNDIAVAWADTSIGAAAKFKQDTGLQIPKAADWNDPAWRRWIAWRHQEIAAFILRVHEAARGVSPAIATIVETLTMDYDAATILALDGSTLKSVPGLTQVWEVDALSDKSGMRGAKPDDWISLIAMCKFAKGASGQKPSWIFTYGKEASDALLVMAEALATGNHPYETKIPQMTTSVGGEYRRRMFAWIKQEQERLFASESAAKVAVYYSPASRDYVDRAAGSGLFASIRDKDALWWANERSDSLYSLTYLAEYRGITKWLLHHHIPFDIIVSPDAAELARYKTVIAPALTAISDQDAELLDEYVANGGHLITTGAKPAMLDGFGNERASAGLRSLAAGKLSALSPQVSPRGSATHIPQLIGKSYLRFDSGNAGELISETLGRYLHSPIVTNAGKSVHIELRTHGSEMLLHLVNPERLWKPSAPKRRQVSVQLDLPAGLKVTAVQLKMPELPRIAFSQKGGLPYRVEGERLSVTVPLQSYGMVVISTTAR